MTDRIASQYLVRPDETISTTDQVASQYLMQLDHLINIQPVYFPTEALPRSADPVYISNNSEQKDYQICCCVLW